MSNKFYLVFVGAFVLAVGAFMYAKWKNGGFKDANVSIEQGSKHVLRGFYLDGTFKNEADQKAYDKVERSLVEQFKLEKVSAFYYLNPTKENRESYKVFIGEELVNGTPSVLPDTLETRTIELKNVIVGTQECNPSFHTIPDAITDFLETKCEADSLSCMTTKSDSIFEQYSRDNIKIEMSLN